MCRYLEMSGFHNVRECRFGEGKFSALINDNPERRLRSFYMEAEK